MGRVRGPPVVRTAGFPDGHEAHAEQQEDGGRLLGAVDVQHSRFLTQATKGMGCWAGGTSERRCADRTGTAVLSPAWPGDAGQRLALAREYEEGAQE